jgi:hypothetical protein
METAHQPSKTVQKKSTVPRQDPNLWGGEMLNRGHVVDWCTAAQAQEHRDAAKKPDSVLQDIASGRIESTLVSPKDAQKLLRDINKQQSGERKA